MTAPAVDQIVAYIGATDNATSERAGAVGTLTDWNGQPIGRWRIVARWRTPRSFVSDYQSQIVATLYDGRTYTGRSGGIGLAYVGRRVAAQRHRQSSTQIAR